MLDFSDYITERTKDFTGREWVFTSLDNWFKDKNASRIFILTGEPGIGKSAVACRLLHLSKGQAQQPESCTKLEPGLGHICTPSMEAGSCLRAFRSP